MNRMKIRNISFFFFLSLCLAASFYLGYFTHARLNPASDTFPILNEAYSILHAHAFDDLPSDSALEYGMIHGMLQILGDPYTRFVEPAQHELETDNLEGEFGGIGVALELDAEGQLFLYPFPEGPAARAGILGGDRLLAVDDLSITSETTIEAAQAAIRGPEGEEVRVTIARSPEGALIEFSILRQAIALPTVTWRVASEQPQIGIIKINLIAASTPEEVQTAVRDLIAQGVTRLVLDLRDNTGGLLDPAIEVARLFLLEGAIIQQQYRGEPVEEFRVTAPGPITDTPILVLINHSTASAAEIIAGALQAQGRARLLGTPSFGKDSIQLIFDLQDGSSLHVTSARWWLPDLKFPTEGSGLLPDIPLPPDSPGPDPALALAISTLSTGP